MAPVKQFVLASLFLASAMAQPARRVAPFPYPVDNSTLSAASGTAPGFNSSSVAATSLAATSSVVSAAEFYQTSSSAASSVSSAAAEAGSGSGSESGASCAAAAETVTVTAVNTVTETVIPSAVADEVSTSAAGSSAASSAASLAASSAASSGFAYSSGHGYGHLSLHKTGASASANSTSADPPSSTFSAKAGEFYVPSAVVVTVTTWEAAPTDAPAVWTYTPPASSASSVDWAPSSSASSSSWSSTPSASSTSSAYQATESSASSGTGKRGVAYNSVTDANLFSGYSEVTWAYNWGQTTSGLDSGFSFIPMLWGLGSTYTSTWQANAQAAISAGTKYLQSFNEPDQSGQSMISPSDAANGYMTYMQPFAGQAKLGSPAVTNGGGSMGLSWLESFTGNCTSCTIDFTAIHWYGTESSDFISHCQAAYQQTGKPIWVTEFGLNSGDASSFLQTVMPWMDSQDYIEYYAYFMAEDGILVSGDALSALGQVYVSSSSSNSSSS